MDNYSSQKIWSSDFTLLCIANLMIFTSFYCLLPTLPVYITDVLKGDAGTIGYIFGVFALAAVVARPLAGYLSDTVGRKPVLLVALFCLILVTASYHIASSLTALFVIRALHGISWGFTSTAAGALAADIVPESKRGEGLGYYSLSNTLAMAVGPGLGLAVLEFANFSVLFSTCLMIAIIGLACLPAICAPSTKRQRRKFNSADLFEIQVIPHSLITFCVAWMYGSIISFIVIFGKQIGIENAGSYFLVYAAALVVSRPYAGRTYDREGPMIIMGIGFLSLGASFILLYFSTGYFLFLASALLQGIGFGVVQSTILAMAIAKVEPNRRGAATGTVFTAFDLGVGLGSIVLGMVSTEIGMPNMYLICGFLVLAPAILFFSHNETASEAEIEG